MASSDVLTQVKKNPEKAIGPAIAAWRKQRAPRLAELVDALEAAHGGPPFAGKTSDWLAAAKKAKGDADRGPLIRSIIERTTTDILATLRVASEWDDPRLGTQIIALLTKLPFSGKRTRDVWREVFRHAEKLRDPRFLALAAAVPDAWNVGEDTKRFLTNRLEEANKDLEAVTLPKDLDAAISEYVAKLAPSEAAVSEESLLASIYDAPDDDAPRLVYADWLQEKDDPRGELIALQLRGGDQKRVNALIKANKKKWLGELAPVLGGEIEFRRGFPATATVKFRNQRDAEQYGQLRAWATFESIELSAPGAREDQMEWEGYVHPAMSNLREVHGANPKFLLAATKPWRIEHLAIGYSYRRELGEDAFTDLCASPLLPKLRRVTSNAVQPDWLKKAKRVPPEICVWSDLENRGEWLKIARSTKLEKLILHNWIAEFAFSRDEDGAFTRLDVTVTPRSPVRKLEQLNRLDEIVTDVRSIPPGELSHLEGHALVAGKMVVVPQLSRS
jgi:uncharacterized protein (TIGR02996 family)